MANVTCHVVEVDAEGGLAQLKALPGAIRATAANAVTATLKANQSRCTILEPTMSVEVTLPADMVGSVLSDLTGRRGTVGDVLVGEEGHSKSLVRGDVPLVEILGYANSLRSLTGGEAAFSAEYKGHSPCQ
jgi:elongation factor G